MGGPPVNPPQLPSDLSPLGVGSLSEVGGESTPQAVPARRQLLSSTVRVKAAADRTDVNGYGCVQGDRPLVPGADHGLWGLQ